LYDILLIILLVRSCWDGLHW